jgi:hypothetical protein
MAHTPIGRERPRRLRPARVPARSAVADDGAGRPGRGTVLALLGCCFLLAPGVARAGTVASIHATFSPDRLGASTAVTLAFRFSAGEEGVPQPLRGMVVHLPAGLYLSLRGVPTCARARLLAKGPAGCPPGSLLGRGRATVEVHAGSQTLPEQTTISAFRGPNRGSRPTLEIFGHGETPLDESTLSTAVLEPDSAPYGSKLSISIPPIPTLVLEPDASFVSLSLTLAGGGGPAARAGAGAIFVPRRCPGGGFPLAASFAFADHSSAGASTVVPCP